MRKLNLLFKSFLLLCALIAGSSAWAATYNSILTLNCASASNSSDGITTAEALQTFLNTAAGTTNKITVSAAPSGNVYGAKGSGGTGIPDKCLKVGKASGPGGFSFTIDNSYTAIDRVVITGYGWKTTSKIAVNGSATQSPQTAATETTFTFDLASATRTFSIDVTTSAVCITSIELLAKEASGKTATAITINGTPSTEVYMGDAVTSPSGASVKAGGNEISTTVTWSSSNTGVATINPSTGAITLIGPGSTTIKATFAETNTYQESEASYTLNVYGVATNLAELQTICKAYGNTAMKAKVTLNNVYVTGVKNSNAYISDGTNGAIIYKNSHGFNAGDKLSCSALEMTVQNYNGAAEITSLTSGSTGLTVTPGQTITPTTMSVNAITAANFGTLVKITGVTYDATAGTFKDNSANSIVFYDNFSASPTLNDGEQYDVTGIILLKNSTIVEICPRNAADVVAKAVKTTPTSVWKVGGNVVTSIAVTKGGTISPTFNTNSNGTKSFESSNPDVATVNNTTGAISLTGTAGIATITASTASNNSYYSSSATLTIIVGEPVENAVFNFGNYQDYGSGVVPTSENVYVEGVEKTWTAGDVTMKTNGKIRWYIGTDGLDLKLYSKKVDEVETTKIKISAPSGKKLIKFIIKGSNFGNMTADKGTYDSGTWTGSADEVTLTYGGSKTTGISTLTVFYTDQEIAVTMGEDGYMTYCNKDVALSFGDLEAFIIPAVGADNVTLSSITQAPSNTPVVLKGTAGSHNLTVLESAEAIETNKLRVSGGSITTTEKDTRYALAKKNGVVGFYKVSAGTMVPEGKCYISVSNTAQAESARDFLGFIEEGATRINAVENGQSTDEVFDLQGRQVKQPTKGLYIKNGKKVIIK